MRLVRRAATTLVALIPLAVLPITTWAQSTRDAGRESRPAREQPSAAPHDSTRVGQQPRPFRPTDDPAGSGMVIRDLPQGGAARTAVNEEDEAATNDVLIPAARRTIRVDRYGRRFHPLHTIVDPYQLDTLIEDAFREGVRAGRDSEDTRQTVLRQRQKLETEHARSLRAGTELLQAGEYARATVALTMAAKVNQGDPLCRVRLALSRLGQGHYGESSLVLQRALALQPKLIYLDLRISESYPEPTNLATFATELSRYVSAHAQDRDAQFLRGYVEFQLGNIDASNTAFRAAARCGLDSEALRSYLDITKPSVTATRR